MAERPDVPEELLDRLAAILEPLPDCRPEPAWVGLRWRVAGRTVAHVFGGEDQQFRVVFRGEPAEVQAFEHLGAPYFRADWGRNVIGLILDVDTDWEELTELLTDSYCVQAPERLADRVIRPAI